jgi:hypothetical protein
MIEGVPVQFLELQRLCLPLIARRREMAEWERPRAITP